MHPRISSFRLCARLSLVLVLTAHVVAFTVQGDVGHASQEAQQPSFVLFQLDNDLFTGSDRNYTNGVRFAYLRPVAEESLNNVQRTLRTLSGARKHSLFGLLNAFIDPQSIRYDWGVGLTQLMFTPDDHTQPAALPGERPYAAWLGFEFSLHAKDSRALSSVILAIGTTGKAALGQPVQDWVHRNISNSPIFQGWDSQVPAEFTVNLHFDRKRRLPWLSDVFGDGWLDMDGYLEWGLALGNFRTDAYLGTLLRIGYNLPLAYMHPRVQLGTYAHQLFLDGGGSRSRFSASLFGGVRGTAVAHDITLDGPWFRNHANAVGSESSVGEVLFGFGLRYGNYTLSFSRTYRSKEFKTQPSGHQFGSVLLSLGF